jgi:hypothetical protein
MPESTQKPVNIEMRGREVILQQEVSGTDGVCFANTGYKFKPRRIWMFVGVGQVKGKMGRTSRKNGLKEKTAETNWVLRIGSVL